ncbi:MAG: dihydropteroate synthase [Microbacterium sp.]
MTAIWGVVNVTPDSFSDGGEYFDPDAAIAHGWELREQGAVVLDVGGESTRPGAEPVGAAEEIRRVVPVISGLRRAVGALVDDCRSVSIDTYRAETAEEAIAAGARIINDVSGGLADPDILRVAAQNHVDIVLGHWRGPSADMYARADYDHVAREVAAELRERVDAALDAGILRDRIIVDPGIGFAKQRDQNWELLRDIDEVLALGHRVLIGTSRKRFLRELLRPFDEPFDKLRNREREMLDVATAVTSVNAQHAGVWGVRVHNVEATRVALSADFAWKH